MKIKCIICKQKYKASWGDILIINICEECFKKIPINKRTLYTK